jgi:hypothetical protein
MYIDFSAYVSLKMHLSWMKYMHQALSWKKGTQRVFLKILMCDFVEQIW